MDKNDFFEHTPSLTEREQEILTYVAAGLSNCEIAERLSLSQHTVAWYIRQIHQKLKVKRRTQAVAAAREFGLLDGFSSLRTQLPKPLTPLVGRQDELTQILTCLSQAETRLLTIYGPGGIGKTRLALQASEAWEQRASIVHFVELEAIQSVEHVVPALAETLGFQFQGQLEPRQQLFAALRHRTLLLVLDNCEHLLEVVPLFTEMLKMCPELKILTTSREPLNQRGETLLRLRGLSCQPEIPNKQISDAVSLFLQCAHRMDWCYEPNETDLQDIGRVCQMVEGMPLAIELAARWVNHLSPSQIVQEVEKGLSILADADQGNSYRHHSMESVFAHSWMLLTQEEQSVFKKLSVFQGDFSLTAAQQVAGASLSILKSLTDKCFVRPEGRGRYSIHALLRHFGADKLALDAEVQQESQIQYARYYLKKLHRQREELEGRNAPAVVQELRKDMDNIWAAWRKGSEFCLALEIAQASRSFTILHTSTGLVSNLVEEIEYVLPYLRAQQQLPNVRLALADILMMLCPAYLRYFPVKALQIVEEAAAHLDRLEKPPDAALVLCYTIRAMALMAMEQVEKAAIQMQTAADLCEHLDDHAPLAWAALTYTAVLVELERFQQAYTILEAAQNRLRGFDAFFFQSYLLSAFALVFIGLGQYQNARRTLLGTIEENRIYTPSVSFELFLLAAASYFHKQGFIEQAFEMSSMYFRSTFVHLLLPRKAKKLLSELENCVPPESKYAIEQRADNWFSETASPRNPLGLRVDFLDYVTGLIEQTV